MEKCREAVTERIAYRKSNLPALLE